MTPPNIFPTYLALNADKPGRRAWEIALLGPVALVLAGAYFGCDVVCLLWLRLRHGLRRRNRERERQIAALRRRVAMQVPSGVSFAGEQANSEVRRGVVA